MKIFISLIAALFVASGVKAADIAKKDLPKTLLIKKDADGTLYVHRSSVPLDKVDQNNAKTLEKLKFVKVSSLSEVLNVEGIASATDELDRDRPRQSWYVWYGGYYGYYYPYNPVYYYSYTYYPYYYYGYRDCNYYWYGYY